MTGMEQRTEETYRLASERYAEIGVNTDVAIDTLSKIAISLHCWQGDDVAGFENMGKDIGGGLAVTGNYPGRGARPANSART